MKNKHGYLTEPTEANNGYVGNNEAMRREHPGPRGRFSNYNPETSRPLTLSAPQAAPAPQASPSNDGAWNTGAKMKIRNQSVRSPAFSAPVAAPTPAPSSSGGYRPATPSLGNFASQLTMGGDSPAAATSEKPETYVKPPVGGGSPRRSGGRSRGSTGPAVSGTANGWRAPMRLPEQNFQESLNSGPLYQGSGRAPASSSPAARTSSSPEFQSHLRNRQSRMDLRGQGGGTHERYGMSAPAHWASQGFPVTESNQRRAVTDEATSSAVRNPGRRAGMAAVQSAVAVGAPFLGAALAGPALNATGVGSFVNSVGPRLIQAGVERAGQTAASPFQRLSSGTGRVASGLRRAIPVATGLASGSVGSEMAGQGARALGVDEDIPRLAGWAIAGGVGGAAASRAISAAPRVVRGAATLLGQGARAAMRPSAAGARLRPGPQITPSVPPAAQARLARANSPAAPAAPSRGGRSNVTSAQGTPVIPQAASSVASRAPFSAGGTPRAPRANTAPLPAAPVTQIQGSGTAAPAAVRPPRSQTTPPATVLQNSGPSPRARGGGANVTPAGAPRTPESPVVGAGPAPTPAPGAPRAAAPEPARRGVIDQIKDIFAPGAPRQAAAPPAGAPAVSRSAMTEPTPPRVEPPPPPRVGTQPSLPPRAAARAPRSSRSKAAAAPPVEEPAPVRSARVETPAPAVETPSPRVTRVRGGRANVTSAVETPAPAVETPQVYTSPEPPVRSFQRAEVPSGEALGKVVDNAGRMRVVTPRGGNSGPMIRPATLEDVVHREVRKPTARNAYQVQRGIERGNARPAMGLQADGRSPDEFYPGRRGWDGRSDISPFTHFKSGNPMEPPASVLEGLRNRHTPQVGAARRIDSGPSPADMSDTQRADRLQMIRDIARRRQAPQDSARVDLGNGVQRVRR